MVSTRSRASESTPTLPKRNAVTAATPQPLDSSPPPCSAAFTPPVSPVEDGEYERLREARIRENRERMQKLGLFDLSHKLKKESIQLSSRRAFRGIVSERKITASPVELTRLPQRRSSRLKDGVPHCYAEDVRQVKVARKKRGTMRSAWADYSASAKEIYTEEHEKLLGSYETTWTLFVDGCGPDGRRVYDQVKGQTCHQCRQKTLGHRTRCSKCDLVQGQFCGDCLFMRYGENVLEANANPDWICPVCRGICNCSICRSHRGWAPTGTLYRKAISLGYKSVAHYLILSQRLQSNSNSDSSDLEDKQINSESSDDSVLTDSDQTKSSAKRSLTFPNSNAASLSVDSVPQNEPKKESTGDSGDICNDSADVETNVQSETNELNKLGSNRKKKTKGDLNLTTSANSIASRLRSRSKISDC